MSSRDFRLSKNVMPRRYDLRIEVDLENWKFRGEETIDIEIGSPTAEVALHAIDLDIDSAHADAGSFEADAQVETDKEAEIIWLRFAAPLPAGSASLKLKFRGAILERLRGFYRSTKDGE
ncbi:MAG TPA: hypothetical protein VEB21_07640, partial [Terriglobales bacterium]|nr:hypothetical protein [Terriglobales bacterium]